MTTLPEDLSLASEFPAADQQQWRELALRALRKTGIADENTGEAEVERLLASTTYDGIRIPPLYTADAGGIPPTGLPGFAPFTRGASAAAGVDGGWDVRQRHADPDPGRTRNAILADLENGVSSVWLALGRHGIAVAELTQVLDGVHLDLAGVVLDAGEDAEQAAEAYLALVAERGVTPASGNLGLDPLGLTARTGRAGGTAALARFALRCASDFTTLRAGVVDATVYHDAGGSASEEIGAATATGVAYLRALTDAGLDTEQAFEQLEFRFAADADQFLTIAKLRAARRVWGRVAQECGVRGGGPHGGQRQHAVTSAAMSSARDPWVNMLRVTLACFGAGVGGAGAVTVQPFDHSLGLPDSFARRIARNTQTLLIEEAHVGRVADPAGGSWYVERLTEDLAQAAWAWFTEIERAGGMAEALRRGLVAERLARTWSSRAEDIAHRRAPLTGVSEYPNLAEVLPDRAAAPPEPGGGLPKRRYAEAFEELRDRSDAHAATTGTRPTVFLATLGPVATHTARASFAANLFAAGGIATVTCGPVTEPDDLAKAFTASGARAACLCSSERTYAELAEPAAQALRTAGANPVWLAGAAEPAGVDARIFAGCDAVAALRTMLDELGVDG